MPGRKDASLKKPAAYEAMRKQGMDKSKAARISNAAAKKGRRSRKKG